MNTISFLVDPVYRFVAESSLAACPVVCLILLVQRVFRGRFNARWHSLLWLLLVGRLVLPWTPQCPASVASLFSHATQAAVAPFDYVERQPWTFLSPPRSSSTPAIGTNAETAQGGAVDVQAARDRVGLAICCAWMVGAVLLCSHVLVSCCRLPRRLRNAQRVTDARVLGLFEECRRQMGVTARPMLMIAHGIECPIVCGIANLRMFIPTGKLALLSSTALRHIFLHELAHLKRRDLPVALLTSGLQALHWFNPFVWYGFHRMRQDREFACDALALSCMPPEEADDYGRTLIKLMEGRAHPMRLAGAAAILEHESQLKRRIEMIMQHDSTAYRLPWMGLAVFALCAVLSLTRASANPPSSTKEKAAGNSRVTAHREGDRGWLDGVKGWSFDDKASSVHAASENVMRAVGNDIGYDYLVGVSGLAFRMQVYKDSLCPSSPHSRCGYPCTERSAQALPWDSTLFQLKPDEAGNVNEARKAVVASIDRGVPVQYGIEEDGVIVGYRKNGNELVCFNPWKNGGRKTHIEKRWPWDVLVYTGPKKEAPSKRALAVGALKQAVQMAETEEAGKYYVGFKAWQVYIDVLMSLDKADKKTRNDARQGNAWIYECLASYRNTASRYLREIAPEFDKEIATHLLKAADLYADMASRILRDDTHSTMAIAPYPGTTQWTAEMRKEEIARLNKALPVEREAIQHIKLALKLVDDSSAGHK